jgi:hypothetical protein
MSKRPPLSRVALLLLGALLLAGCQPFAQSPVKPSPRSTASSAPSPSPSPSPSPTPAPLKRVFVIVLENASASAALRQPYIASLASQYAVATDYHALAHPSLPNYLALTSGSTWGIRDDGYHQLAAGGIGAELTTAGISWKAYMEGFTGNCFRSPYPYALKHNPFAYYGGQCPANVVPMTQLSGDLSGSAPQLSWITPGLCNDGHDCGVAAADRWLAMTVPQIIASPAWQQNGALFITWDEDDGGGNQVALIIVTPTFKGPIATPLDHYSLLATICDELGVARLGASQQAKSISAQLSS